MTENDKNPENLPVNDGDAVLESSFREATRYGRRQTRDGFFAATGELAAVEVCQGETLGVRTAYIADTLQSRLDVLKERVNAIKNNVDLSGQGRRNALDKLDTGHGFQADQLRRLFGEYLKTAEREVAEAKLPDWTLEPGDAVKASRQIEIRNHVRRMDQMHAVAFYFDHLDSAEITLAIENAPWPLLPAEIVERTSEARAIRQNRDACLRKATLEAYLAILESNLTLWGMFVARLLEQPRG